MKNIIFTKDSYSDKSVRINYWFENDKAVIKYTEVDEQTGDEIEKQEEITKNTLVFCETLSWENTESELDSAIESTKIKLESKLIGIPPERQ
jgi:non-homologous end joining protein Ku